MVTTRLPASITVASGAIGQLASHLRPGSRVLLVTNRHLDVDLEILGDTRNAELVTWSGEPNIEAIDQTAQGCRVGAPNVVVAVGGGSVLDAAKALAAAIPNDSHPLQDHLEIVGSGRALQHTPLPVIAAPTTAGTGSEMTKNAVLDIPSARLKVSLRDHRLVPEVVIIDPDLAESNPRSVATACALDAAVQLIESFATPLANPLSDIWALSGAERGLAATSRVVAGDNSGQTRLEMAVAAMCSGAALATSKLGTIHGFAGVVGGLTGMAHGQLCGLFAAPVLRRTIERLQADEPEHPSLDRYRRLAVLAGRPEEGAMGLVRWFSDLIEQASFDRSPLAELTTNEHAAIVAATRSASSTTGNPQELSPMDLTEILDEVATS